MKIFSVVIDIMPQ